MRTSEFAVWLWMIGAFGGAGCADVLGIDGTYRRFEEGDVPDAALEDPELDAAAFEAQDVHDAGASPCEARNGTLWEGRCYFAVGTDAGLDWNEAKSRCEALLSSHLVTIASDEEQALVERTFFPSARDAWIGLALSDTAPGPVPTTCTATPGSCPFVWVTREPFSYSHWTVRGADDEPNYSGACVRLLSANATWADYPCTTKLSAICEAEASEVTSFAQSGRSP